jgi:transposase
MAEKRRIVESVLQPGVSVARVAQAEGVNANQVFKWRREYRSGRLVEAEKSTTSLLPVVVSATSFEAAGMCRTSSADRCDPH